MKIKSFFDPTTATVSYVVSDPDTLYCAIIDSVLDFDLSSGTLTTTSADKIIDYIEQTKLTVEWILETHIHADHLTAASYLKEKLGGKLGIGEGIKQVLEHWVPVFNNSDNTPIDGSQFDVLFADGATFKIGNLDVNVMTTPGHTPDSISYLIEDALFVGDSIFMPYVGTARTDFPGGSAEQLYHSIQKILALPDQTHLFVCHDYPLADKQAAWVTTVMEEKQKNIMISASVSEQEFVTARNLKDVNKPVPKLLLPALQVNLRAGKIGKMVLGVGEFLKIPINGI